MTAELRPRGNIGKTVENWTGIDAGAHQGVRVRFCRSGPEKSAYPILVALFPKVFYARPPERKTKQERI